MSEPQLAINLSLSEAIVLFEWLAREDGMQTLSIKHPAEQNVLWRLEGQLEKQLPVFAPNYGELVAKALKQLETGSSH